MGHPCNVDDELLGRGNSSEVVIIVLVVVIFRDLIWRFSGSSEGGVGRGMFFLSNGVGIMPKHSLEVDLW